MPHPVILSIETSTNVCSVAVSRGEECLFSISNDEGMNHAALLSLYIDKAIETSGIKYKDLDAVAVSGGPGSYTGLRIGVSTAKGICYALDIPLISINTLEILTIAAINQQYNEKALYCPMIDARRMEEYSAFYRSDRNLFREVSADIITTESYLDILEENTVYFFGNGSDKCKEVITHPNAIFIDNLTPLAENMIKPALEKYESSKFEDTAYFEPFYLKEFQATTPKKNF